MDKHQAKELLSFHSSRNDDIHNPKWENGFLGSLRPFGGELHKENFFEVMEPKNIERRPYRTNY